MTITIESRVLRIHITDPATTFATLVAAMLNKTGQYDSFTLSLPGGDLFRGKV